MSAAVAAASAIRQLSRLELLPRELRDNIYSYLGLSTKITDAGLRLPTPLGVRIVFLVGRRGLQVPWRVVTAHTLAAPVGRRDPVGRRRHRR